MEAVEEACGGAALPSQGTLPWLQGAALRLPPFISPPSPPHPPLPSSAALRRPQASLRLCRRPRRDHGGARLRRPCRTAGQTQEPLPDRPCRTGPAGQPRPPCPPCPAVPGSRAPRCRAGPRPQGSCVRAWSRAADAVRRPQDQRHVPPPGDTRRHPLAAGRGAGRESQLRLSCSAP